jgi:two-component sensor histidine kinase
MHMRIGDDGVGLADRTKWEKPESLGMDLIHTLAGQLGTTVDLMPGAWHRVRLVSVHQEKRKRA